MSILILIAKIVIVIFFLAMFLRSNKLVWGIGLLTVTSAILLDTFFSTFGRDEMIAELGFFFYVFVGVLVGGATLWFWLLYKQRLISANEKVISSREQAEQSTNSPFEASGEYPSENTAVDRQLLYEQIRYHLGPDDLLDLIFDLGWVENDLIQIQQSDDQLAIGIIELAQKRGQVDDLALAIERILTPISADHLPRREKLSENLPPTVLRHYLLANYSMGELEQLAAELDVDWELIDGGSKKPKVRNLLLYLSRRNRIPDLIDCLQKDDQSLDR